MRGIFLDRLWCCEVLQGMQKEKTEEKAEGGHAMKAITLIQPWATLMAIGEKHNETRGWYAYHRGVFAIHAGKKIDMEAFAEFLPVLAMHGYDTPESLPTGCIVAVAHLEHCTRIDKYFAESLSAAERSYGDYREGRYAWRTKDTRALARPVTVRGAQGLWYLPLDAEKEVRTALEALKP